MRVVASIAFLILLTSVVVAQPSIRWQQCLGGSGDDKVSAISRTPDGGYLCAGNTHSNDNSDLTNRIKNDSTDAYVVKLRSDGSIAWQRCYGSKRNDRANDVKATPDGGGILGGYSDSVRGPWVVKFDATGAIEWQNGDILHDGYDEIVSIAPAQDGGYMLAGGIASSGGGNGWVAKLSHDGATQWQKTYGKTFGDRFHSITTTQDGGFAIAGGTVTLGEKAHGVDYWVIRLNDTGGVVWQRSFGGTAYDEAFSIIGVVDGGFLVSGQTTSNDDDVTNQHGEYDMWVLKLSVGGDLQWEKALGGSSFDGAAAAAEASDHSFYVAGYTTSADGDVLGLHGASEKFYDEWLVHLDPNGHLISQLPLGGTANDIALGITLTSDNSVVLAGYTDSPDGDVIGVHSDSTDGWVLEVSSSSSVLSMNTGDSISLVVTRSTDGRSEKIFYSTPDRAPVTIALYNLLGQQVRTLDGLAPSGQARINVSGLPPGRYFVRLSAGPLSRVASFEVGP
jgi:hypothetical protein